MDGYTITVRFGTSRGADTYGYTTCTASVDGKRLGSCNGGGYDLEGTAIAEALMKLHGKEIAELSKTRADATYTRNSTASGFDRKDNKSADRLYGLTRYIEHDGSARAYLDGACGLDSVWRVLDAIGYTHARVYGNSKTNVYNVSKK